MHYVVLSPGYKDRVKFTKGNRKGHPQRYWLELITSDATRILAHYLEQTAQEARRDLLGLTWMGGWVAKSLEDLLRLCRCAKLG